jgi:hypothetical protein
LGKHDLSNDRVSAAVRVVQYCHYKMCGLVGVRKQIMDAVDAAKDAMSLCKVS